MPLHSADKGGKGGNGGAGRGPGRGRTEALIEGVTKDKFAVSCTKKIPDEEGVRAASGPAGIVSAETAGGCNKISVSDLMIGWHLMIGWPMTTKKCCPDSRVQTKMARRES